MESYFAGMVVETNLELVKYTFSAEDIKSNPKAFRKSNRSCNLKFTKAQCQIVKVSWNVAAVSDYDHLQPALLNINFHTHGCLNMENTKHSPRVNIDPHLFVENGNGNYRYQVTFVNV